MGNKRSVYGALGASNHSPDLEREKNDFYATPPVAVEGLLKMLSAHGIGDPRCLVYEPCCGKGHIANILAERNFKVIASDLVPREWDPAPGVTRIDRPVDFFKVGKTGDGLVPPDYVIPAGASILTNPPYGMSNDCVRHALDIVDDGAYVMMSLKIQFLETIDRYKLFMDNPPLWVFVCSERMQCAMNGDFEKESQYGGAVCYAWYVWRKGYHGYPSIDWIPPTKQKNG